MKAKSSRIALAAVFVIGVTAVVMELGSAKETAAAGMTESTPIAILNASWASVMSQAPH